MLVHIGRDVAPGLAVVVAAATVAAALTGRTERTVTAHLRGGDLKLEWSASGDVFMTGPATESFRGSFDPADHGAEAPPA